MQNYIVALAVSAMLLTVVSAFGDALFEVTHVVKMPKRTYGYRGMNGDLLQLKDGSILYCYTAMASLHESPWIEAKRGAVSSSSFLTQDHQRRDATAIRAYCASKMETYCSPTFTLCIQARPTTDTTTTASPPMRAKLGQSNSS